MFKFQNMTLWKPEWTTFASRYPNFCGKIVEWPGWDQASLDSSPQSEIPWNSSMVVVSRLNLTGSLLRDAKKMTKAWCRKCHRIIDPPKFNMRPENHEFQCLFFFPGVSFLESILNYSGVKCWLDLVDWRFISVASNLQIHPRWASVMRWLWWRAPTSCAARGYEQQSLGETCLWKKPLGVSKRNKKNWQLTMAERWGFNKNRCSFIRIWRWSIPTKHCYIPKRRNSWSGCYFSVDPTTDQVFLGGWTMPGEISRNRSLKPANHKQNHGDWFKYI